MKVGVVIDSWKLPIFLRHLSGAGLRHEEVGGLPVGTVGLCVFTDDPQAVARILQAAHIEAEDTQKGSPDAN